MSDLDVTGCRYRRRCACEIAAIVGKRRHRAIPRRWRYPLVQGCESLQVSAPAEAPGARMCGCFHTAAKCAVGRCHQRQQRDGRQTSWTSGSGLAFCPPPLPARPPEAQGGPSRTRYHLNNEHRQEHRVDVRVRVDVPRPIPVRKHREQAVGCGTEQCCAKQGCNDDLHAICQNQISFAFLKSLHTLSQEMPQLMRIHEVRSVMREPLNKSMWSRDVLRHPAVSLSRGRHSNPRTVKVWFDPTQIHCPSSYRTPPESIARLRASTYSRKLPAITRCPPSPSV